ncbi:MAG: ATP synthase F1 subunit delta [Candidatus Latescibacter sp.]|nr:ATP synthase F1 subunit delta [Candidatus Latescibacter sp.]
MIDEMKIAKRYARVFLNKKMGSDSILTLAAEMQFIADAIESDSEIKEFFKSPVVPRKVKLDIAGNLVKQGGFSRYTLELLLLLINRNRADIITYVSRELHFITDELLNRIRVRMTTAAEPSVTEIEGLSKKVGHFFGKNVFVERYMDPSIIGGFILEGEGKLIDLSVKGQIRKALSQK